jgi:hypothetical protein
MFAEVSYTSGVCLRQEEQTLDSHRERIGRAIQHQLTRLLAA